MRFAPIVSLLLLLATTAAAPPAGRITDPFAAGDAAYRARDAMKLFEAYGPLIADGEVLQNGHLYDRLALARRKLELDADDYWGLASTSATPTGKQAMDAWRKAAYRETDPEPAMFNETLKFGDWFTAYMYGLRGDFLQYDHRGKLAIEAWRKSVTLDPNPRRMLELGELISGYSKDRKEQVVLARRAAEIAESQGWVFSEAYRALRYYDPEYLARLASYPLNEQARRDRWFGNSTDPIEKCAYMFANGHFQDYFNAYMAAPLTPQTSYWMAAKRLESGDKRYDEIDIVLGRVLALDPKLAPAMVDRVTTLIGRGKPDSAVILAREALALAPPWLRPRALAQQARALFAAGQYGEAIPAAEAWLAAHPGNTDALDIRTRSYLALGKLDDALYWSAQQVALVATSSVRTLRGDIHALAGRHVLAAYNYRQAMIQSTDSIAAVYPRWSAAVETYRAEHCGQPHMGLLQTLASLSTFTRDRGDLRPRVGEWDLGTEWQRDGSLRVFGAGESGIVLNPDGVHYRPYLAAGKYGSEQGAQTLPDGRRVYPLGSKSVVWGPDGTFFVGRPDPFGQHALGVSFDCAGTPSMGPFLASRPAKQVQVLSESTSTVTLDGKDWTRKRTRLSCGYTWTEERRLEGDAALVRRTLDCGELGVFHGTQDADHMPRNGVFAWKNGRRSIIHAGGFLQSGEAGTELKSFLGSGRWYVLLAGGDLEYRQEYGVVTDITRYPGDGGEPVTWRVENNLASKPVPVDETKEQAEPITPSSTSFLRAFDFKGSLGGAPRARACYRCKGMGMVWVSGGASQSGVAAPSYLSPSQAESWRNSSASVRTVYTSGHMETCPVCHGEGQ